MSASRPTGRTPCIALFDLDGTLTWRDTLLSFLAGYVLRHPVRLLRLWRLPAAVLRYLAFDHDRGLLKSRVIATVLGGDTRAAIDAWADRFVGTSKRRGVFRPAALAVLEQHRAAGDHLILLSASPDLYVPRIGRLLRFERTLCTEIKWRKDPPREDRLDGALLTANRHGEEKSACLAWLRTQYPGLAVIAYGNSASDLPHLTLADRAILVNGSAAARRSAAAAGLGVAEWTAARNK